MAGEATFTLSDDLAREQRERQEQLRLNAQNVAQENPAHARRVLGVQHATGLPAEVVDADLDNLEKMVLQRDFDMERFKRESPAWASFTSENPYHLSVLKDDMEQMGTFERAWKQIGLGWDSTWATVELGRIRARQIDGDIRPEDEAQLNELQKLQVAHEFGAEGFTSFLVKNAKMLGPTLYSMGQGLKMGVGTGMTFGTAAGIAGQVGPQAALPEEVVTVPGAFLIGLKAGGTVGATTAAFELERGLAYDEYIRAGYDPAAAKMAANSAGAINASLEMLSIAKLTKYLPGMRGNLGRRIAGDVLTKPTIARATANMVGRFGEVLGTEVVTEVMQESVTAVAGEMIRPDGEGHALTWDSYVERVSDVALETMQGAFLISTIGPGMSYYADVRKAQHAENMSAVYQALGDSAKASKTREALKGKYREFVDRMTQDGAIDALYIDADRFDTYFQEKGQDPDSIAASLKVPAEALEEARTIGGDIRIPIDEYADNIAPTEHHDGLLKDLKSDSDKMSARDAELFRANSPNIIKELEALQEQDVDPEYDAQVERILQDVTGQLVAAGYEPGAAGQLAQVMRGIPNLAREMNMDPEQLYERIFGGVKRVTPESLQAREDIDMIIDPLLDRLRKHDFPSQREMFGQSLTEFLKERGGLIDDGGELSARDVQKQVRGLVKKTGDTLDGAAEAAQEAGFIAERDPDLLLEAIDRELSGEAVFGSRETGSSGLRDVSARMDELATMIQEAGLDIESMSNEQVRTALEKRDTLNQIDTKELRALTDMVVMLMSQTDEFGKSTVNADMLGRAQALLPDVFERQDFGDVTFTDTVRVQETGEKVKVTERAQKKFDRAVKRKNVLTRLLDCVSG